MDSPSATTATRRRMERMAEWIPAGSRVADIGSDHGLLLRILIAERRLAHGIATEKSPSRLETLRGTWPGAPPDLVEFRHGDGLAALRAEDRIDTAVIAGMGARTILRILDRSPLPLPPHLILQPQTEAESLRAWVRDGGWDLDDERLVVDRGRGYFLLSVRNRSPEAALWRDDRLEDDDLLHVGPHLLRRRSEEVRSYWESQRRRIATLARGGGGTAKSVELRRIERILQAL